jgi:hypothetical protein
MFAHGVRRRLRRTAFAAQCPKQGVMMLLRLMACPSSQLFAVCATMLGVAEGYVIVEGKR